ncbi:MAG TPA: hypothetical protein DCP92_07150 [Nitrospiraceae bacterium]|jgi:hypothetical protein|nr:hypothetical protein [Nitrospiraceae bacterium]
MQENVFYRLDPLLICLVLVGVLVAASEIGFWVKGRMAKGADSIGKGDIPLIIGAVLTLLALLLGFTYSMSEGRFEERRQLVIDEANAIGTTYLRAKALPEPRSSEIQRLLRQYTALLVEIAGRIEDDPEKIRAMDNREKKLESLLWSHAAALARENPNPVISAFFVPLNEMIDLRAKKLAALRNRVPFPIYVVLLIVSVIALLMIGSYLGSHRQRALIVTALLALLVASVMWLIMDLDQPVRGAIRTSQQSLIDLNEELSQESGEASP